MGYHWPRFIIHVAPDKLHHCILAHRQMVQRLSMRTFASGSSEMVLYMNKGIFVPYLWWQKFWSTIHAHDGPRHKAWAGLPKLRPCLTRICILAVLAHCRFPPSPILVSHRDVRLATRGERRARSWVNAFQKVDPPWRGLSWDLENSENHFLKSLSPKNNKFPF